MGVAQAEKELEAGKYALAAGRVVRMIPYVRAAKPGAELMVTRAMRVLAVSTVRLDGRLPFEKRVPKGIHRQWPGSSAEDRQANLEWSVATLEKLNERRKNDPALLSELGEAMARVDRYRDRALDVLGKLAARDLLASPEAYAALARLRNDDGDDSGSRLAANRCLAMANEAALCHVTGFFTWQS
ncbi:MAG: hypothetical protein HY744_16285 [Deltaproteobacteria bacterium]|nr:hypothetical protein [Deltaproteobacteria bacterium]